MGSYNRRNATRIPLQITLNEYLKGEPERCMTFNISTEGIYVNRLVNERIPRPQNPVVGIEFELPGTSESVWARGRVTHEQSDEFFTRSGIRFEGMAQIHEKMIRDYVLEQQASELKALLAKVRRNRHILLN